MNIPIPLQRLSLEGGVGRRRRKRLQLYIFVTWFLPNMYNFWKNFKTEKRKKEGKMKGKEEMYHLTLGNIFNLPIWASIVSFIKREYQELCCLLVQSTSIYWVYRLSCCELAIINVVRNWTKWFRWCVWLRESTQWMPLFFFHFSV